MHESHDRAFDGVRMAKDIRTGETGAPGKPASPGASGALKEGVTRREVLKAAAAAAVAPGLGIGASAWVSRSAYAAGSDTLRVALIGCGGRGTGAATQALAADEGAVLYAMADMFEDRMESSEAGIREHLGGDAAVKVDVAGGRRFVGVDAYKGAIESGADVVLLTAYPHFRPAHLVAAVDAGKHVFCEKPMGVDAPGLRAVRAACERAKERRLAVVSGFCWRYGNAERAAFEKINSGLIGDIVTVHTTYHTGTLGARPRRPEWSDLEWQMRNWWHFTWLSGDHIVEQACHSIDRMAWAMNDAVPERCVSLGGRQARQGAESGHVYDHFAVVYEYADGRRAFHTCRQMDGCPSDNTDYVYGTKGRAVINGWIPRHDLMEHDGRVIWKYEGVRKDMYQNEHDALFESIRKGEPINDGVWMCNSTMMSIMGRMAAYTGQTIGWEQAWASEEELKPASYEFGELPVPPVAVPGRTRFY